MKTRLYYRSDHTLNHDGHELEEGCRNVDDLALMDHGRDRAVPRGGRFTRESIAWVPFWLRLQHGY